MVKKNYNHELEEILEQKNFTENVKSTLLSIFYKIEAAYPDVITVKQDVETKEEYLKNLISIIQNDCEDIQIVSMHSEESNALGKKNFLVDQEKKQIIAYPIERKILYAISKIGKRKEIVKNTYFLLPMTISDLINVGNNIHMVEPLRDFNGYSWTTLTREMESIDHNLIYQNLRILVGHEFLNQWISNTEFVLDYFELFQEKLEEMYGKIEAKEIVDLICQISVLLEIKFDPEKRQKIIKLKEEIEEKRKEIENREQFITNTIQEKQNVVRKIKEIDTILNDKEKLQIEYSKRNETLPLEKKIFSIRILADKMIQEREQYCSQMEELDTILKPQNFVAYQQELEEKYRYLKIANLENLEEEIQKVKFAMQKVFLTCFSQKIQKTENKQEIMTLLYEYRYYQMIPYNQDWQIKEVEGLTEDRKRVTKQIQQKTIDLKIIIGISDKEELNEWILQKCLMTRMIRLEDLYLTITKEKEKFYLQLYEEDRLEEKIEIQGKEKIKTKDFIMKLNKKTKLFN